MHLKANQGPIDMGVPNINSFILEIHLMYWVSIYGVFGRLGHMFVNAFHRRDNVGSLLCHFVVKK
jgi:hypothetical protein